MTIGDFVETNEILIQFVLDPSSMNLSPRVHINDPILPELFKLSRDLCFAINKKSLHDLAKEPLTSYKLLSLPLNCFVLFPTLYIDQMIERFLWKNMAQLFGFIKKYLFVVVI